MNKMITDPQLASPEDERALIGSILLKPSRLDECSDLSGLEFVDADLGATFEVMRRLRDAGAFNDAMGPAEILLALQVWEAPATIANPTELKRLMDDSEGGVWAKYHAGKVKRAATVRRHIEIILDWQKQLTETSTDPLAIAQRVESELAAAGARAKSKVRTFAEVGAEVIERLAAGLKKSADEVMVGTGLESVDASVGGMHPGELIILAARTGQGKTAFALQVATHNARQGRRVLVVSLEMTNQELTQRVLCAESGVDNRLFRTLQYNERDVERMRAAYEAEKARPVMLYDPPAARLEDIRAIARLEHSRAPLSLLVVDYLQFISGSVSSGKWDERNRALEVGRISRGLKSLAKELGVPVLALCQVAREVEKQDREPRLSDMRESGSIEQDADIVFALQRGEANTANLFVLKQRHGITGKLPLKWNPQGTCYEEDAPEPCAELQQWSEGWSNG